MVSLHQPLIYVGDTSVAVVQSLMSDFSQVTALEFGVFGIDDVRRLIETAMLRPATGTEQVLVIIATGIGREAQQALLKLLEEPPASTKLVWALPKGTYLLPTIVSRVRVIFTPDAATMPPTAVVFWEANVPKRLEIIKEIAATAEKNKHDPWPDFFAGMVAVVSHKRSVINPAKLKTIEQILRWSRERGAAKKMMAEELAFALETNTAT